MPSWLDTCCSTHQGNPSPLFFRRWGRGSGRLDQICVVWPLSGVVGIRARKGLGPVSIRSSMKLVPPCSALHPVTTYESGPVGMMTDRGSKRFGLRRVLEQAVQGRGLACRYAIQASGYCRHGESPWLFCPDRIPSRPFLFWPFMIPAPAAAMALGQFLPLRPS